MCLTCGSFKTHFSVLSTVADKNLLGLSQGPECFDSLERLCRTCMSFLLKKNDADHTYSFQSDGRPSVQGYDLVLDSAAMSWVRKKIMDIAQSFGEEKWCSAFVLCLSGCVLGTRLWSLWLSLSQKQNFKWAWWCKFRQSFCLALYLWQFQIDSEAGCMCSSDIRRSMTGLAQQWLTCVSIHVKCMTHCDVIPSPLFDCNCTFWISDIVSGCMLCIFLSLVQLLLCQ